MRFATWLLIVLLAAGCVAVQGPVEPCACAPEDPSNGGGDE